MRGDHLIILAVLSAASIVMMYNATRMSKTEVYIETPHGLRHPEPVCCQADTPICKACQNHVVQADRHDEGTGTQKASRV